MRARIVTRPASHLAQDTNAAAFGVRSSRIALGWEPFGRSPLEYQIRKGNACIGSAAEIDDLRFVDNTRSPLETASYSIVAINADRTYSVSNAVSATTPAATPVLTRHTFEQDAAIATAKIAVWEKIINNGRAIQVTREQSRAGSKSVKFDFRYEDWVDGAAGDINQAGSDHCMVTQWFTADYINATLGTDMWVGISTYFDTWPVDDPDNGELVWQFHGSSTGPATGSPPLALYIHGSDVQVKLSADPTTLYGAGQPRDAPIAVGVSPIYDVADLLGVWVDWVIRVNFHLTAGLVQVWKDGVLVVDYTGSTIYQSVGSTTSLGPFFNFGIYKWDWGNLTTNVDQRTIYVDEVRIGNASSVYADVAPG